MNPEGVREARVEIAGVALLGLGVYVPRYRLAGETVARAFGTRGRSGERAVANHDEDSLTMAVASAFDALEGFPGRVDAIDFATCTPPYQERNHAAILATVLRLPQTVRGADFGGSPHAAAAALRSAADAAQLRRERSLVVAAELRSATAGSELEGTFGDGAVALIVGPVGAAPALARLEAMASVTEDFPDRWQTRGDSFLRAGDPRFVQALGYERLGTRAVGALLGSPSAVEEISWLAIGAPDERVCAAIERALRVDRRRCAGHGILARIGDTGTASAGLALAAALEKATPGERVVTLGFGGGADAALWRVEPGVEALRKRRPLAREIEWKRPLEPYGRFLRARGFLAEPSVAPFSSPILYWREERQNLGLAARRCRRCGTVEFPGGAICGNCRARGEGEEFPLQRRGRVFTYTHDHLVPSPDPPTTMVVVDLDGGGRFYCQATDGSPEAIRIGLRGELVLRKLHAGAGFQNYFWKFRPLPPSAGEGESP